MNEIKFFTNDLREGVLAEFCMTLPAPAWTQTARGEIIHSLRDNRPAVVWPKARTRFATAPTFAEKDVAEKWILGKWME